MQTQPPLNGLEPVPGRLISADIDGFKALWKNDGTDYPALWQAFRKGELPSTPLSQGRPFRETWLIADFRPGQILSPQEEDIWREEMLEAVLSFRNYLRFFSRKLRGKFDRHGKPRRRP